MARSYEEGEQIKTRVLNDPASPYDHVRLVPTDGTKPDSPVRVLGRLKGDHTREVEL